jgi:hypothetical protein
VSGEQVKSAPNIELHGEALSKEDESTLYHHYQLLRPARHRTRSPARPPLTLPCRRRGTGRAASRTPGRFPSTRPALRLRRFPAAA